MLRRTAVLLLASSAEAFAPGMLTRAPVLAPGRVAAARLQPRTGVNLSMNAPLANISPLAPTADFDRWNQEKVAYPHIPAAGRYSSQDWINNLMSLFKSGMLKRVRSHLIANVLFAVLVYSLYVQVPALAAMAKMLSPTAHSLAGGALSLLLVFRTNSSYNRFYEARCLWGKVTNTIREMARFAHTNLSGLTREHALSLTAAYPTVMLQHLQQNDPIYRPTTWSAQQEAVLKNMLSEGDYKCLYNTRNRAFTVGKMLGAVYRYWYYNSDIMAKRFGNKDGTMTDTQRALMQANVQSERTQIELMLETMCNCFGACERIVRSQVPPSYSRHTSRFLSVWCFTLPFVLVQPLQWLMIPTVTLICWSLFVIEEVGHVIEDPFNIHLAIAGSGQEDGLIIEGSQMNLKLDSFERIPGPSTRVNGKPTYDGEELDFDFAEFHEEWLAEARKK